MEPPPSTRRRLSAYEGSKLGFRSQLNIFELPITDASIVSSKFMSTTPIGSIKDEYCPVIFNFPPTQLSYIDLNQSNMYVQVRLLNKDDSILTDSDLVAPSNMFYYSMWKNLTFSINGITITNSQGLFAYEQAIPTLLTNGSGEKNGELSSILFYPDTIPNDFDITRNIGFKKRIDISSKSKLFDLLGPLPTNFALQTRYLPFNCGLKFEFHRQDPAFCLDCASTAKEYKISIERCVMNIKLLTIADNILSKQNQMFAKSRGQYPFRESQVRAVQISRGTLTFETNTTFMGKVANTLILGLVAADAFNSNLSKNYLNFETFNLGNIKISCGEDTIHELKIDYSGNLYLQAYNTLFKALSFNSDGNNIDRNSYKDGGNSLYLFNLLPATVGSEFNAPKYGQIKIELQFTVATPDSIYLVMHAAQQSLMELDHSRNIYLS